MAELKRKPRMSGAAVAQLAKQALPDTPSTTAREAASPGSTSRRNGCMC